MRFPKLLVVTFSVICATMMACDSTEPEDHGPGDQELITRVALTFESGDGTSHTAAANDPEGDGRDFMVDTIKLSSGTSYTGSVELTDEINKEDITEEIKEEGDVHQFFYTVGGAAASQLTVNITDKDENGLPVGLAFTATVADGPATTGTLRVVLGHYDDVVKNGTNLSNETDIDVTFPVEIR